MMKMIKLADLGMLTLCVCPSYASAAIFKNGFLVLLLLSMLLPGRILAQGEIKTTDYGTTPTSGGAFFWRGYSFQVSVETTVTHLIGGGQAASASGFQGAIFSANASGTTPTGILRLVNFTGSTVNQVVALGSNLVLQPGTWYFIAQGDTGGSPTIYHWYVDQLNADDLVAASFRISAWLPGSTIGCHYWSAGNPASVVVGVTPSTSPNRPALGFRYLSSASLPAVETTETPMFGRLTDRGNAATALYIEYGTSPTLSSGTTLNLAEAGYEGSVPYTYGSTASGLSPSTTYYYRARAINDAGRVEGIIRSFTTPAPPVAPVITSIDPGNTTLTVNFTHSGNSDNIQYSLNGGSTWISRSPASSSSPLLITGLSNGTTYPIRIRAVYQGITGSQSSTVNGTPVAQQTGITGSVDPASVQYGATSTVTASGGQSSGGYEFRQNGGTGTVGFSGSGSSRTLSTLQSGTAVIEVRKLGDSGWSTSGWVSAGTLTITKAPLTVTADSKSKVYGDADPVLTYTPIGTLYNGDGYDVITGVSLDAPTGSAATAAGQVITTSGGTAANYDITPVNGTLTVHARPLAGSFTVDSPKVYDDTTAASVLTRNLTNLAYTDTQDAAGVQLTGGNAAFDTKAVGTGKTVTLTGISLSGARSANYVLQAMNTTTADIVPGPPAMTVPPQLQEQGSPLPALGEISDQVAGQLLEPIKVRFFDQYGNSVAAGHSVTVSVSKASFAVGSTLVAVTDSDGYATFDNLAIEQADPDYEITFTVLDTAVLVTSDPFDVIPASASGFVFSVAPVTTGAGYPTTFTIQTVDVFGNVSSDHAGFTDILRVTGDTAFAAGHDLVDFPEPPVDADPFDAAHATHSYAVCFRMAGEYTQTVSAAGMIDAVHVIDVEPTILWSSITNTDVTYMDSYTQILYAYDPASGPIFDYSATGLPPGLSIGPSFDLIDTIAGNGDTIDDPAHENGPAVEAAIGEPQGVAVSVDGTVYLTDAYNGFVRKRTPDGTLSKVFDLTASFGAPWGIAMNEDFVYVSDAANATVYALDRSDDYSAVAIITNGLFTPFGLAVDGDSLYIADTFSHRVRVYDVQMETLDTVTGTGSAGYNGDGMDATLAQLNFPEDVAVGPDGALYIADTDNHRIRKVDDSGIISTVAGTGDSSFGGDGGLATAAFLQGSAGIAVDSAGRILISDTRNNRLRLIRNDGIIETIAGGNTSGFSGDGGDASDARMLGPTGISIGSDMSIYIADTGNARVRQVYLSVALLSGQPEDVNRDEFGNLIPYAVTLRAHPGYGCGVDYPFDLDVLPKTLQVINASVSDKTYDATPVASVSGAQLSGIEALDEILDDVTLTASDAGTFAQDGVGQAIPVSTIMGLAGDQAYRYTLTQPDYLSADITPRAVTYIVEAGQGKIYGDPDFDVDLTGAVDAGAGDGLVAGHLFTTGSLARVAGASVGPYAIGQGTLAILDGSDTDVTGNYDLTFMADDFVIDRRSLTITANHRSKLYGVALDLGTSDFSLSGLDPILAAGEVVTSVVLTSDGAAEKASVAGSVYAIHTADATGTNGFDAANYDITYSFAGELTVNSRAITVIADNQHKIYGETHDLGTTAFTVTGETLPDEPIEHVNLVSMGTALCANVADVHLIVASDPTGADFEVANYTVSFTDGVLNIAKADQEIDYTAIAYPVEWRDVIALQALRVSDSGCAAPATTIQFAASAPGIVDGGEITFNMRGPVTITASLDGDANYNAAADVIQELLVYATPEWESTPITNGAVCSPYSYRLEVSDLDGWRWDLSIQDVNPATPDWLAIVQEPGERRIHLFAGTGIAGNAAGESVTGANFPAQSAEFSRPYGLAVAADMTVYLADRDNHVIRRISPWGSVEVIAGTMGVSGFDGDAGPASSALLSSPRWVYLDAAEQFLYVSDTGNHRVRRVELSNGTITTVAGNGFAFGTIGENVSATSTRLDSPYAVVGDAAGDFLYIAASGLHRIRVVDLATGQVSTLLGSGISNPLNAPTGLFLDGEDLYIADRGLNRVALYDFDSSSLTTVAGTPGTSGYAGDGGVATAALLNHPYGVTVVNGVLYVTDSNNNRIRAVDLDSGIITTLAGDGSPDYFGDNILVQGSRLNGPRGIVSDGHGQLLFADMNNNRIRRIDAGTYYLQGTPSVAGDYDVTLWAGDTQFDAEQAFTITVDQDTPTINTLPTIGSLTYGDPLATASFSGGEVVNSCGQILAGTFSLLDDEDVLNAGTHVRTLLFTPDNDADYTTQTAPVSVTVELRMIAVYPDADQAKVFGQSDPVFAFAHDALVNGDIAVDVFTGNLGRSAGEDAGHYALTLGSLAAGLNYTLQLSVNPVLFEITPKPIVVTPHANQYKLNGEADPVLTYTHTPLEGADEFSGGLGRELGEILGQYPYMLGDLSAGDNYSLSLDADDVQFEISANPITVIASVTLSDLVHTYDGTGKSASVVTVPAGLTVVVTYDGDAALPISAGSYLVSATVTQPNYQGSATGLLIIGKASQAIDGFLPANAAAFWVQDAPVLSAAADSGLGVSFSVISGPATVMDGTNLSFNGVGDVHVRASQAGNANWLAAPSITNQYTVSGGLLAVLGADDTLLESEAPPSTGQGTAFGIVFTNQVAVSMLSITNAGNAELAISGVTTNGSAYFSITGMPAVVSAGSVSNFWVVYAPETLGAHQAVLTIACDVFPATFDLRVAGTGIRPGEIWLDRTYLSYETYYNGPDPAGNAYSISNRGDLAFSYTNEITYGGVVTGWFQMSPMDGVLDPSGQQWHTGTVSMAGMDAGTYLATNTITGTATNAPVEILVELKINRAAQTITFAQIAAQLVTNQLVLTAGSSSGLPVEFEVLSGPALIEGGVNLSFTGVGDAVIRASQAGDGNHHAASDVSHTIKVFSVEPDNGAYAGGNRVTITGGWLGTVTNVLVDGVAVDVEESGSDWVRILMPFLGIPGLVDIVVQTVEQDDITLVGAYTYNQEGVIAEVSLPSGAWTGGYAVVISGSDLGSGVPGDIEWVTLAGVTAQVQSVSGSTQVVVVAGTSITGGITGDVVIYSTSHGESLAVDAFTYLKTAQTIIFPALGNSLTTGTVGLVASATSGLEVEFEVISGPGVISSGTNLTFTGAGVVSIAATQAGNLNWYAAAPETNSLTVTKAMATVTLDGLIQVYDGMPLPVTVQTVPEGLTVEVDYDGSVDAPVGVGMYAVTAVIADAIYQGQAEGVLQILAANPPQILSDVIVRIAWSPYFEQTLEILSHIDCEGLRVIFTDLQDDIEIENKTGDTLEGDPMIELYRDIEAGETVTITVRYVCRGAFMVDQYPPTLTAEYIYPGVEWDSGHHEIGGGWRWLSWFGFYVPLDSNWIWHDEHGYLYVRPGSIPRGISFYSADMGWLWTSRARYPYLYRFSDQRWLWYLRGSMLPRWFYNLGTGGWEQR